MIAMQTADNVALSAKSHRMKKMQWKSMDKTKSKNGNKKEKDITGTQHTFYALNWSEYAVLVCLCVVAVAVAIALE